MQNYMRTILSGLQNWINKRFRDEVAVADQNENNPDSPAYIKNRTHYEEWGEAVLMPETKLDLVVDEGMAFGLIYTPIGLEAGKQYKVKWNGTEYITTAIQDDVVIMMGNIGLLDGGNDTGEPFILQEVPGGSDGLYGAVILLTDETEVVMSIEYQGMVVHKLDDKYINFKQPDMYAFEIEPGYIKNRTHWVEKYPDMSLDYSNIGDKESFTYNGITYYKVSNLVISLEAESAIMFGARTNVGNEATQVRIVEVGSGYRLFSNQYGYIIIVNNAAAAKDVIGANNTNGTYIGSADYERLNLTLDEVVHKLDEKFIDLTSYYTRYTIDGSFYKKTEVDKKIAEAINAPAPTAADAGKILRVNSEGKYELVSDEPKQYVSLVDATTGDVYRITINNGTLVSTLVEEVGADE